VAGGVGAVSVANWGNGVGMFNVRNIVGSGVVSSIRDIRVTSGIVGVGNINNVSGSLDLFTLVVVGGDGSSVGGGVSRGDVGREERFTEEIRVSEVAVARAGDDGGGSNGFNVVVVSGRNNGFNVVVVGDAAFNLVGGGGGM
jgi:hypothetical protein